MIDEKLLKKALKNIIVGQSVIATITLAASDGERIDDKQVLIEMAQWVMENNELQKELE